MSLYLVQASYTAAAFAAMIKRPQDREPAVRALVEKMGGQLHGLYFSLGEYDVLFFIELPDDTTAMSVGLAITAPGHLVSYKTTKLLSAQDMLQAQRKAGYVTFAAPTMS